MSTDPTVKDLLERNKQYAANASPLPFFSELPSVGLTPPHMLILTCADPRCIPEQFLGLQPADAVIMRNMCGHAAPALNDIIALDHFIVFSDIMVIHHTGESERPRTFENPLTKRASSDCGSLAFTDDQVRATLRNRQPDDGSVDAMTFGTIRDLKQSVRDDLALIKGSSLVRKELADRSYGFIYDIKTGLVSPLED